MLSNQKLDSMLNRKGQTIIKQESIIVDNKKLLDKLTDSIFDLKEKDKRNRQTIAYYKGVNTTSIKKVEVPYLDSIGMKKFSDSVELLCEEVINYLQDSTVLVGSKAYVATPYYEISQTINKSSITIDSLKIKDTLQLRFVERSRFLKSPTIEVQFFHTNPYISTSESNSVIYKPKKKSFFKRVVVPVAVGVAAGILISK